MNDTDKKLYELLGDKTLSLWCLFRQNYTDTLEVAITDVRGGNFRAITENAFSGIVHFPHVSQVMEIIGHEPTIADFHRWMNERGMRFRQWPEELHADPKWVESSRENIHQFKTRYDSSKPILSQSEETKLAIIKLIESYARD